MSEPTDELFYDGACGLCHHTVAFVLRRGKRGEGFRFAPLQGGTFQDRIPERQRASLPDSVVILTADGRVLMRSQAILHLLQRLGGGWRCLALIGWLLPRFVSDSLYDIVAKLRHRFFKRPSDVCPRMSLEERQRFDP